ncbi:TetR/AcrR family transcriptional regulator [Clostridium pasteurianum]|uniref:Transcriptional regulator n=1 Tax=Clostridium pasteurianum BC1 TaxID=86416 RepID=R4K425_CLOPA|nr:TetR/AcrR family transcriptional regulator [Clostridium pasteurianum]AGK95289.1 transcriptional regulator [Clostridium pasteurianum BC1]
MVRESKEQVILEAAIKIFAEKSYNGTTTSEIAREAGVAEGTIFRYFKTKKDLLRGILNKFTVFIGSNLIDNQLSKLLEKNKDKDEKEILKKIIINRIELIKKYKDMMKIMFTEMQFSSELREDIIKNILPKAKAIIRKFVVMCIEKNKFREVNLDAAETAILGIVLSYVIQNYIIIDNKSEDYSGLDNIIDIVINGLKKQ